jgi:solute carrier family 25 phosphate transporter 3
MVTTLPPHRVLQDVFSANPVYRQNVDAPHTKAAPTSRRAMPYYTAFSTIEDKASKLSAEASKEIEKASAAAQAKVGKIEMYSSKFYATCILGGVLACVYISPLDIST